MLPRYRVDGSRGVEGREGGGFGLRLGQHLFPADADRFEEFCDETVGAGCLGIGNFGAWSEVAEVGIGDDLFDDGFDGRGGVPVGQVERGDLETVEEETGAAGVDLVGGDAAEDLTDGELDGSAVLGEGKVEGGLAAAAGARVGDGLAGGVVEVAELFPAERRAAAAAAFGVDVAALEAFGCGF